MAKRRKKNSTKAGLPPGSLVYIGEKEKEPTSISYFDYDEQNVFEKTTTDIDECLSLKHKPTVTWINIDGINHLDVLDKIGSGFG